VAEKQFTQQQQYLLDVRQSALKLLAMPEGEKLLEFLKFTGGYYVPLPSKDLQRNEGFRAAVCLIDLFKRSVNERPEDFLRTIELWDANFKA